MKIMTTSLKMLAGVVAVAAVALIYTTQLQAAPATTATPVATPGQGQNEHPHIRAAIKELHAAVRELKEAKHDFGGHREDAVRAAEAAIEQLKQALEYRKAHAGLETK